MRSNIHYILLTAMRDWLFAALLLGVVGAAYLSSVMGSTALLEPEQMILSFTAASTRIILVLGLIVFICFHVRNAFDSKEIDVLLSRPMSRATLVISYWVGFAIVALILAVPAIGMVGWMGVLSVKGYAGWAVSLLLELWLVVAIALFCALTMRSAVFSVLSALAIYTISRMMGFFVMTLESGLLFQEKLLNVGAHYVITVISMLVPRQDFFAKTEWLVYGYKSADELWHFVLQAGIFVPLLIVAAVIDFRRRQF